MDLSLRSKLLGLLVAENADRKNIENVMAMLDVSFSFPVTLVRISQADGEAIQFDNIISSLFSSGMLDQSHDFWSIEADCLSIICSSEIHSQELGKMYELAGCRIIMPLPAADYGAISKASSDALWLERHMKARIVDLADPRTRLEYMMHRTAFDNSDIIDSFITEMKRSLGDKDIRKCMEAAMSYYDAGMSVTKAAEELGIHKNTLQSRVKRVIEAAGIEDYPLPEKLYLMRLIYIRLFVSPKTLSSLDILG